MNGLLTSFAMAGSLVCMGTMSAFAGEVRPLDGLAMLESINARITNIDIVDLADRLEKNPELVLIDVRTPSEINMLGGTIRALNNMIIPRGWVEFRVPERVPNPDTPVVVYCGINQRSPLAADTLMKMGYRNVANLADGFFAWRDAGLPVAVPDRVRDSMLYRKPERVADNVWSAIGATAAPSYENSGHNNNLSFIVTDDGVLVVNAGDNYLLAQALHDEIRAITDQPVRYVVLENGQGHAALGSAYWQEQGVPVIAHVDAAREIEERAFELMERMGPRSRDKAMRTRVVQPDQTFEDRMVIEMGGERIELIYLGPAHSPGDISVWLPSRKLVIAGDIAFHQRLLPIFQGTDTAAWIETWNRFMALGAEIVIPGHGDPTNMEEVRRYTLDYLVFLRGEVRALLDAGGDLNDAYHIDQSAYAHLDTFNELARRNAGMVFEAMQFE